MFYKPKYCCNCAEKIERVDWNLLTSRRFCEVCAVEKRRHDHLLRGVAVAGILGTMFGVGSLFGGSGQAVEPIRSSSVAPAAFRQQQDSVKTQNPQSAPIQAETAHPVTSVAADSAAASIDKPQKQTNGTQYSCGALTKKGTPCSRKVKAAGTRCFQHEGKSAAPEQNQ